MDGSLGAGFDHIRATLLSPSNFVSSAVVTPVFTHTMDELEDPARLRLAGAGNPTSSRPVISANGYRIEGGRIYLEGSGMPFELSPAAPSQSHTRRSSISEPTSAPQQSAGGCVIEAENENSNSMEEHEPLGDDCLSQMRESEHDGSETEDFCNFYTGLYARVGHPRYDEGSDSEGSEDSVYDDEFEMGVNTAYLNSYSHFEDLVEPDESAGAHFNAPLQGSTQERNLTVEQFIRLWLIRSTVRDSDDMQFKLPRLAKEAANVIFWNRPERVIRPQTLGAEFYDIQQIPWRKKLSVSREDARALRDAWYTPYRNLDYPKNSSLYKLPDNEFYFREKAMYANMRATIEHFQLRNLMSVPSSNTLHFARESKVLSWTPVYDHATCLIDLSHPASETGFQGPVKISSMRSKHGISVAGGFCGEYCMHVERTQADNTTGFVTTHFNGITNHIDIIQSRTNSSPMVVFASNDQHIRTLDCATNTFVSDHELSEAVNCTETSADGRLRIVVGDSPDACVLEAESGRPVQRLYGHCDFGFACAWSPDMLHIATSNQDKTVNIWDVRMWRILQSMDSDRAGYRSLRFSPIGGGPRTLLMSEPADRIAIVNAQTYETRQVHDFFGEIGGADYTPDGGSIWVANTDDIFGGFMEYERLLYGQRYGSSSGKRRNRRSRIEKDDLPHWFSDLPHEWLNEAALEWSPRCNTSQRERDIRALGGLSDEARDNLLI